ncbi:Acetolactate synthase isozyme 3 small subunit [Buchnera aphidicola (Periphyllus testudinaceus)]|uniref:ACT domain-containing protein n=1 Tax=Buchnera aphidicola TaxID=9 RepID=UPI003463ABA9
MTKTNLLILLENKSDVLSRIINLFSKTGYKIKNLSISKNIKKKNLSNFSIEIFGKKKFIPQIIKQLKKLIDIFNVKIIKKSSKKK